MKLLVRSCLLMVVITISISLMATSVFADTIVVKESTDVEGDSVVKDSTDVEGDSVAKEPDAVEDNNVVKEPASVEDNNVVKEPASVEDNNVVKEPDAVDDNNVVKEPDVVEDNSSLKETTKVVKPDLLNTQDHIKYLSTKNGRFRPDEALTRSETAKIFYALLKEKGYSPEIFTDLANSACYYEANALANLGIFTGYNGEFKPERLVTRAEFATILRRFFSNEDIKNPVNTFTDINEDYWGKEAILFASERGWVEGLSDGTFAPNKSITRAESAVILNRVLMRSSDKITVDTAEDINYFLDVTSDHWAYYDIYEASISHTYEKQDNGNEKWNELKPESFGLVEGLYDSGKDLFYINAIGNPVRSSNIGSYIFDESGRYTTGNKELDGMITGILEKTINEKMSLEEKRRAIYVYIRDNYTYTKRDLVSQGTQGWENNYALRFFKERTGNCYSFASAYGLLLRRAGLEVNFINGFVNRNPTPHSWVEVTVDGKVFIDDPELEMAYGRARSRINFYNFTYATMPLIYKK